jgi:hypothetical protein
MDGRFLRDSVTDAIRYWQPRRLVYNGILFAVVLIYFVLAYPASRSAVSVDGAFFLFLLAVLANVAYCAVYVVDIFAQASDYRERWKSYRWVMLVLGTSFAGIIARFWAVAMFPKK